MWLQSFQSSVLPKKCVFMELKFSMVSGIYCVYIVYWNTTVFKSHFYLYLSWFEHKCLAVNEFIYAITPTNGRVARTYLHFDSPVLHFLAFLPVVYQHLPLICNFMRRVSIIPFARSTEHLPQISFHCFVPFYSQKETRPIYPCSTSAVLL